MTFFDSPEQLFPFDARARKVVYDHYHGYRYAHAKNIRPAWYFGFGLTYTRFSWSRPKIEKERLSDGDTLTVSLDITNRGNRPGEEVVQLYVEPPHQSAFVRPAMELRSFCRVAVNPGETRRVVLSVPVAELAFYNDRRKRWEVARGRYTARLGPCSDPLSLNISESFYII